MASVRGRDGRISSPALQRAEAGEGRGVWRLDSVCSFGHTPGVSGWSQLPWRHSSATQTHSFSCSPGVVTSCLPEADVGDMPSRRGDGAGGRGGCAERLAVVRRRRRRHGERQRPACDARRRAGRPWSARDETQPSVLASHVHAGTRLPEPAPQAGVRAWPPEPPEPRRKPAPVPIRTEISCLQSQQRHGR